MQGSTNIPISNSIQINKTIDEKLYDYKTLKTINIDDDINSYISKGKYINKNDIHNIKNLPDENIQRFILTVSYITENILIQTINSSDGKYAAREIILNEDDTKTISNWTTYISSDSVKDLISTTLEGCEWKEAVNEFQDILTTYPNPLLGWTVSISNGNVYRYNGIDWILIYKLPLPDNLLNKSSVTTRLDISTIGSNIPDATSIKVLNDKIIELDRVMNLVKLTTKFSDISSLNIGDEISYRHKILKEIPFVVIGKNHDADNSITILSRDIIKFMSFDAKEPTNPNTNRSMYGNNRYKYSNIHQWINSDIENWYKQSHSTDEEPKEDLVSCNPYNNLEGLLNGFGSELLNLIIPVTKTIAIPTPDGSGIDTITCKAFLLSSTEVGFTEEIQEGEIYEYFEENNINSRRLSDPTDYALENRDQSINVVNSEGHGSWWLRTPNTTNSYMNKIVCQDGTKGNMESYEGKIGIRIAMCLRLV